MTMSSSVRRSTTVKPLCFPDSIEFTFFFTAVSYSSIKNYSVCFEKQVVFALFAATNKRFSVQTLNFEMGCLRKLPPSFQLKKVKN